MGLKGLAKMISESQGDSASDETRKLVEELAYNQSPVEGYEFDGYFNEFVKAVKTKEEAVAEVKSIIARIKEVSEKLDRIKYEAEHFLRYINKDE